MYGIRPGFICSLAFCLFIGSLAASSSAAGNLYAPYARVLEEYVNHEGLVDYPALMEDQQDLNLFLNRIADLEESTFESWGESEKIAFWINAYNAYTLRVILDHYPIEGSFFSLHPDNSIRQIDGVWDELTWTVMGRELTLGGIEHDILRVDFEEPRIHFAVNCASLGCPALRGEPYVGEKLDAQLAEQVERFLAREDGYRLERERGRVVLSEIFKWFAEDWMPMHGDKNLPGHSEEESAVLGFIAGYVPEDEARYLLNEHYRLAYADYDWELNVQRP